MSVAIVSDTCHYLPAELAERNQIHQVSLYVHRAGQAERERDLTDYDAYYRELGEASELPTTSQPSIGDFLAVYEPLLQAGHEIVSIHLAGGMSGTVRAAEQARDQLGDLAQRVRVVDSATACGGEALMLLAAAAAARAGGTGAEVEDRAREARRHLRLWFAIDTLEYLRRGGRIAGAQAWLGTALKIKPILSVESEITPVERVRTSRRAFEKLVGLLETCHREGSDGWVVQHIQAPEQVAELAARGREIFGTDPVMVSEVGPVIGTHVGPGLLGAGGIPRALMS
ncbi:MAG TPA: DegV family protein [Solirubrobacteraceae bacterium]|jgi:DegV family protein with EDD domain|nr:DegV family protein [Solirubrobacteraceae bacterium]